jgi:hypothetical protein
MAKWKVCCTVTCSAHTIVEAETAEEALAIAEQRDVYLHQQAEHSDSFIIDEADGEPYGIEVVRG